MLMLAAVQVGYDSNSFCYRDVEGSKVQLQAAAIAHRPLN